MITNISIQGPSQKKVIHVFHQALFGHVGADNAKEFALENNFFSPHIITSPSPSLITSRNKCLKDTLQKVTWLFFSDKMNTKA